jgi:methyl-accepting chemotaxis protein
VEEVDSCAGLIGTATREQSSGSSRIVASAGDLQTITRQIASATEEQASGAEQIVKTMERMRTILHQNAFSSVELARSAEQLNAQGASELAVSVEQLRSEAGGFRETIGKFVLNADGRTALSDVA